MTAYVLDSGVTAGHVEFSGRVTAGADVNDGNGSPLVSGVVALILQESPGLSPAQVAERLLADATAGAVTNPADSPNRLLYVPTRTFVPLTPTRLTDSRAGTTTVDGAGVGLGLRWAGSVTEVAVAGRGGVPADASAVVLNVTVTEARANGYVTVFPCGSPLPNGSSINSWAVCVGWCVRSTASSASPTPTPASWRPSRSGVSWELMRPLLRGRRRPSCSRDR